MTSPSPSHHGYRFPPEIIGHAVWLYHRFCLSFRDAEDLLAQRGITVSYEVTVQGSVQIEPIGVPCDACRAPSDGSAQRTRWSS